MGKTTEGYSTRRICFVKSVTIIGSNGQLGTDLVKTFEASDWTVVQLNHKEIKIEDLDSVNSALSKNKTDWIINTAAFHKVNECEENSEKAWSVNCTGALNVAMVAERTNSKVLYISSDYVFSGRLPVGFGYDEDHPFSPINVYGHSKVGGEIATLSTNNRNLVVRIASVFGAAGSSGKGGNFIETILAKAKKQEALQVVNDIHMSPTYTVDASKIILSALEADLFGRIHATNLGRATWFEFAQEALNLVGIKGALNELNSNPELFPKKPANSVLISRKSEEIHCEQIEWQDGLKRYLIEKGYIS